MPVFWFPPICTGQQGIGRLSTNDRGAGGSERYDWLRGAVRDTQTALPLRDFAGNRALCVWMCFHSARPKPITVGHLSHMDCF